MMKAYVLLVAVLGCVLQVRGGANKCDPKLVAAIKNHWGDNEPSNVIETCIANGKEVVVATTDDYFPDNTKCVYAYFHPDGFMFSVIPKSGKADTTDVSLKENDGTLVNLETSVIRYQIYSKGGVMAMHKCDPKGHEGKPKAIIKVRADNYKKENIEEAKKVLQKLGFAITKEYPAKCGY